MSFIEDMQRLGRLRAAAAAMLSPVVVRTTVIATGVLETEELFDLSAARDMGTVTGRIVWAAGRGRTVEVTPIEVQP